MKKLLILLVASFAIAKTVTVSIVPQKALLDQIAKGLVEVNVMVSPGQSPHTYEPKPQQMKDLSKSLAYFAIGVEFEDAWLKKFQDLNKKMLIVHTDEGVAKIEMVAHHHEDEDDDHDHDHAKEHDHDDHDHDHAKEHDEHDHDHAKEHDEHDHDHDAKEHDHDDHDHDHAKEHDDHDHDHDEHADHDEHGHHHGAKDPHIWTSPFNAKIIAKNMLQGLKKIDPKNAKAYDKNYKILESNLNKLDKDIKKRLANYKNKPFGIYHPAWGYFAARYGLKQVPIEIEGKLPKPKDLTKVIAFLKEHKIKTLFVQPEFSPKQAQTIAKEVGANVVSVSVLGADYQKSLLEFTNALEEGFKK